MLMVNEGHEQGVLEAGEGRDDLNIFELNDKARRYHDTLGRI